MVAGKLQTPLPVGRVSGNASWVSAPASSSVAPLKRSLDAVSPLGFSGASAGKVAKRVTSGICQGVTPCLMAQGNWNTKDGILEVFGDQLRNQSRLTIGSLRTADGTDEIECRVLMKRGKAKLLGTISPGCIEWDDGTTWMEAQANIFVGSSPSSSSAAAKVDATRPATTATNSPENTDLFGYDLTSAKSTLMQYFQKRNLPAEVPCRALGAAGPFEATVQVRLPPRLGGAVLTKTARARSKKDSMNQVCLDMCVELCRRGEIGRFKTKTQIAKEGLQPCENGLTAEVELQLSDFVMSSLTQLDTLDLQETTGRSLQKNFDASAWVTSPEAIDLSWSPPEWGRSPWSNERYSGDETNINQMLLQGLEQPWIRHGQGDLAKHRQSLPVAAMKAEILAVVQASPVVMISGSTGCGKTTQVPQYLLDDAISVQNGTRTNIVCTQPRRIAAITAAERVAMERGEELGNSVGYLVRFHQMVPRGFASMCFMTTGMLLRRMAYHGLRGVSHVVIDEVHERDLDTDFLLTIIKLMLHTQPEMRVVLMSATIDLHKWSTYFGRGFGTPIEIPGRLHAVTTYYLEDAMRLVGIQLDLQSASLHAEIPFDFVAGFVEKLVYESSARDRGALLIFLPGWDSISQVSTRLQKLHGLKNLVQLHHLHSQVPKEEQQAAFPSAPPPLVKVILATNIAETSVTISDVVYVVDACRVKQLVAVQSASGSGRIAHRLMNMPAAKQNLTQRAGRAGRVRDGVCYRLCTRQDFNHLAEALPPDMVRLPLHQVALTLKSLNLGIAAEFLRFAPDPPPPQAVFRAIETLQDLKALDINENITCLGVQLAKLPIEPRMGFALLFSCIIGLGEPMAVLCAMAGSPSPYTNEKWRATKATPASSVYASQALASDHHDLLMTYYKFMEWEPHSRERLCLMNHFEFKVLNLVREGVEQTLQILTSMGMLEHQCFPSCKEWIANLGTPTEHPSQRQMWDQLTSVLGLGLEHFAMRQDARKVWLSAKKSSHVAVSSGIPEVPHCDAARPFFVVTELRENEWNSTCRGASLASAMAIALGAARDLTYDFNRECLVLDSWAPIAMSSVTADCLGLMQTFLRVCLLQFSASPGSAMGDPFLRSFLAMYMQLLRIPDAAAY